MNNVEKSGINVVLGVVDNCQGEASFCISCLEHLGGCHQVLYILSQNLKVRLIRNIFHNFQYLPDFLTAVSYFLPSHYQLCCSDPPECFVVPELVQSISPSPQNPLLQAALSDHLPWSR